MPVAAIHPQPFHNLYNPFHAFKIIQRAIGKNTANLLKRTHVFIHQAMHGKFFIRLYEQMRQALLQKIQMDHPISILDQNGLKCQHSNSPPYD